MYLYISVNDVKDILRAFPGGSGMKNSPAKAGFVGSIPHQRWCCMLQGNEAPAPQVLTLGSRAWGSPLILEPVLCDKKTLIAMATRSFMHCN